MLPFVKFFTPFDALGKDEPFANDYYEDLPFLTYAGYYIEYGGACLLDYWQNHEYKDD